MKNLFALGEAAASWGGMLLVVRLVVKLVVMTGMVFVFLSLFQGGTAGFVPAAQREWGFWQSVAGKWLPGSEGREGSGGGNAVGKPEQSAQPAGESWDGTGPEPPEMPAPASQNLPQL